MNELQVKTESGGTATLTEADLKALQVGLTGRLLTPASSECDEALRPLRISIPRHRPTRWPLRSASTRRPASPA